LLARITALHWFATQQFFQEATQSLQEPPAVRGLALMREYALPKIGHALPEVKYPCVRP